MRQRHHRKRRQAMARKPWWRFASDYAKRSGMSVKELMEWNVCLPCGCGHPGCLGWAMVSNNPHSIHSHMELYAPRGSKE
jgi:hypothetical protein